MRLRMYSKAERERLHDAGQDMAFGGMYFMHPEAAERLSYGLVQLDRPSGKYCRVQVASVEERMIIEEARERARGAGAFDDQPAPWSSGRVPFPQVAASTKAKH